MTATSAIDFEVGDVHGHQQSAVLRAPVRRPADPVEEVDHPLCLRRRAKARRMFALVGADTATLAEPRCGSQGDRLAA